MHHQLPTFVVVIHPPRVSSDTILYALQKTRTVAVNSMTYSEWLTSDTILENNLLYLRENGELLYPKSAAEIADIRKEVEALS